MSSSTEGPPHALSNTVHNAATSTIGMAQNFFFIASSQHRWRTHPMRVTVPQPSRML